MSFYTLQSNIKEFFHHQLGGMSPKKGFSKYFPWLLKFFEWIGTPPGVPKNTKARVKTPSLEFDFFVKEDDLVISNYLFANHIWEPNETKIFESAVKPGAAVLDIGAHFGYYSVIAAKKAGPSGHVFSFEPDPENREVLVKNVFLNTLKDQIVVIPKAASHQNSSQTMYRGSPNNSGSRFLFNAAGSKAMGEIETVRVDDWMAAYAPEWIDMRAVHQSEILRPEPMEKLLALQGNHIDLFCSKL